MPIPSTCPSCEYTFQASDYAVGRRRSFPRCGKPVTIPRAAPAGASVRQAPAPRPAPATEPAKPAAPPAQNAPGASQSPGASLATQAGRIGPAGAVMVGWRTSPFASFMRY
jgi:hypothetical protein